MMRFNEVTDEEEEILDILQEECAEIIQAISKIKRHGYLSTHPDGGEDNLTGLLRELGDLDCIRDIWSRSMDPITHNTNYDINKAKTLAFSIQKLAKLKKYTHHIEWHKY